MSRPWPKNIYRLEGKTLGIDDSLIEEGLSRALEVQSRDLPAILSLAHLARVSNSDQEFLATICGRKVLSYRVFPIRKRNGGKRWIAVPQNDLAKVQKWIQQHILSHPKRNKVSYAYWPKTTIRDCANQHCGCKWMIKIDVQQFFENISEIQVYRVFREMGYRPLISFQLARICTRVSPFPGEFNYEARFPQKYSFSRWRITKSYKKIHFKDIYKRIGYLPQGASTSPMLSNLAAVEFDQKLEHLADHFGLIYTRYSDDLTFSTADHAFDKVKALQFIREVYKQMQSRGFRPNFTKTEVVTPGSRKIVLGLLVDGETPRLTREFRDNVRQHLYYAKKYGAESHSKRRDFETVVGFRNHLEGLLKFAYGVEQSWAKDRLIEFNSIEWPV